MGSQKSSPTRKRGIEQPFQGWRMVDGGNLYSSIDHHRNQRQKSGRNLEGTPFHLPVPKLWVSLHAAIPSTQSLSLWSQSQAWDLLWGWLNGITASPSPSQSSSSGLSCCCFLRVATPPPVMSDSTSKHKTKLAAFCLTKLLLPPTESVCASFLGRHFSTCSGNAFFLFWWLTPLVQLI